MKLSMLRHIPRLGFYPKQVIVLGQLPLLIDESKTRTEQVYHEVNGNPRLKHWEDVNS